MIGDRDLPTPHFPDFVSSHSAISASAAEVLKRNLLPV
jgi:hypothetical protein